MVKPAIRMIALDLDNTTLRSDKSLSERTQQTLRKAQDQGIHVVVSTGRVFSALPPAILAFDGIRYMINSNGAKITEFPEKKLIYSNCIAPEALLEVEKVLRQYPHPVEVFTHGEAFANASVLDDLRENGSKTRNVGYILWSRKPVPDVYEIMHQDPEEVENISITFDTPESRLHMKERLEQIPGITVTSSERHCLELGGATTSKAEALRHLMKMLDVQPEELMACGDSPNDEKMIRLAGLGVVMANGTEEMRAIADYVTDTNDNDGVAKAIEKFALR